MIRIIHVIKVMNHGGAETMIMNFYRNIDRHKIQFDFLCMDSKVGDYEDEIIKMGGRIYKVSNPADGRIKNLSQIYKLLKKLKVEENLAGIHSHVSFYSGFINFVAWLAKIKLRISHSHTTNDTRKIKFIRKIYNISSKLLIKLFSNVKLACGEKAGKYLYGNSKFKIINNGTDLEKYASVTDNQCDKVKKELGILKDELVIGNVSRFEEVKNHNFFVDFAKELKNNGKDFKILLVGNGSLYNEFREKIKKEKIDKYFIMPGIRDDINVIMNIMDIFIMPSLYEGFPLVVVEALAAGTPCLLSDTISKETDIIKDMVDYFNLNDPIEIVISKMFCLLKIRTANINSACMLEEAGFSIKKTTKQIEEIYLLGREVV